MAKKPFEWVRDAEEPLVPAPERESYSQRHAHPKRALALASRLVELSPHEWPHLPVSEAVVEGLEEHARIRSSAHVARKRAVGRLGSLLREEDLDALEAALDGTGGRSPRDERLEELVAWRDRLIANFKGTFPDFMEAVPGADRQQIRQLASRAKKLEGKPAAKKVQRALFDAIKLGDPNL